VVKVQDNEFPDHLLYDIENQIWYEPLADGTVRAGFTSWAATLMREVLVFTPKRIGRDFARSSAGAVTGPAQTGPNARCHGLALRGDHREHRSLRVEALPREGRCRFCRPPSSPARSGA
jgi:glycine cleavage system H protein